MSQYIIRRLMITVLLMLGVASFVFFVIYLIPGDVADIIAGERATPEQVAQVRQALGLDRPLHVQYLDWLLKVIHGDLGKSLISGRPVMKDLILQLPRTMELMVSAILLAVVIGIPAGILASVRRSRVEEIGRAHV